jgi:hypothetical protein
MKKFITAESLPKTFQEAIIVTRALGVEYIWIDSLCIIQDDIQDWRYESSQMCDVYNNSYCNIAATHSTNSAGGLFVDRDPSSISCLLIKPEWTGMENRQFMAVLSAVNSIWYSKVEVAPLNQRGWVVQERILAPRTLHFAYNQIMWQCPDMAASETFPSGFANFFPAAFLPANMLSFHDLNRNSLTFWESLIIKYYRCQLTKGNDKLVAIAGIARRLALSTGESYMAGLWRNTLDSKFLSQLLWYAPEFSPPAPRTERPTSYRAPSWSWASIDGIITFCDVTKSKGWERSTPLLQVLQCEVHLAGVDPFGDLTGGYIRISCCLHPITARYERDKWKLLSSDNDEANLISSHEIANSLYFDETKLRAPHGIKEDVKLFLLPILQNQRSVGCIMLSLTGKRQGEYTRVGFFQAEGECANFLADGKRTYKDRSQLYEKQTIRTITIL